MVTGLILGDRFGPVLVLGLPVEINSDRLT